MIKELEKIPHLKRLRIHTRLPLVLPERINTKLLSWLSETRFQVVMVIHANHANELADDVAHALSSLSGTPMSPYPGARMPGGGPTQLWTYG